MEGLEDRFLLYATTGTQWAKPKLITYSFVPDGTSIGGVPSNLQQTLNAQFATADWQAQFAKAAAAWQKMANVNFTLVSDNGSALGVSGNQQNDPRFGDIRIGGYAMSGSILAFAYPRRRRPTAGPTPATCSSTPPCRGRSTGRRTT